jgi:flavin-binding protein dodecin
MEALLKYGTVIAEQCLRKPYGNSFVWSREGLTMAESTYKVIEIIGASSESFEKAAAAAVETAGHHLKDLRIAEVANLDLQVSEGKVVSYRAKVKLSFRYHPEERE